jgi:hypothetical protein
MSRTDFVLTLAAEERQDVSAGCLQSLRRLPRISRALNHLVVTAADDAQHHVHNVHDGFPHTTSLPA